MTGSSKNRVSVLSCMAIILLTSCVPNTYHTHVFQNDSSYDLWMYTRSYYDEIDTLTLYSDSTFVKSGTAEVIWKQMGEVYRLEDYDTCLSGPEGKLSVSAYIINPDTLEIHIDLNDFNLWQRTVSREERDGSGTSECRVIVDNTDIY